MSPAARGWRKSPKHPVSVEKVSTKPSTKRRIRDSKRYSKSWQPWEFKCTWSPKSNLDVSEVPCHVPSLKSVGCIRSKGKRSILFKPLFLELFHKDSFITFCSRDVLRITIFLFLIIPFDKSVGIMEHIYNFYVFRQPFVILRFS